MWSNNKKCFEVRKDLCESLQRHSDRLKFVKREKTDKFDLLRTRRKMIDDYDSDFGYYQQCYNVSLHFVSVIKQIVRFGDINIGKVTCEDLGNDNYEFTCELYYKKLDTTFADNMIKRMMNKPEDNFNPFQDI